MHRIHIVGKKNSGKTTLVVELVRHMKERGLRVGTIKHTHHHHELDTPGKDSHCHRTAGAEVVGILAPTMSALFIPIQEGREEGNRYAAMEAQFSGCDLVIVEGDLSTDAPKLEVWRAENATEPYALQDPSIHALISDDPLNTALPIWARSNIASLAEKIRDLLKI